MVELKHMVVITIPTKLIKDDLVIIPRKEYEKFLHIFQVIPKEQWWFWTKEWQNKEREADQDIKLGRVRGPFKTAKELKIGLDRLKAR